MRSTARTLATILAVVAFVSTACGSGEPDPDRIAVSGEPSEVGDEAAPDEEVAAPAEADHDEEAAHDEEADHDEEAAHDEEADHDEEAGVDMVIEVAMVEFGYEMDPVEIPVGSTVKFVFTNEGVIEHEAVIGDAHLQDEQAAASASAEDGDHALHHGEVPLIILGAGETGELVVDFDEPGEQIIGCHIVGHWDAGMHAAFSVV